MPDPTTPQAAGNDSPAPPWIQLFSFDIVGSASYKTLRQSRGETPGWIDAFRRFFEELPLIFTAEIAQLFFDEPGEFPDVPVWKAIGDELVFMARPQSQRELQLLTQACVHAMAKGNAHFRRQSGLQVHGVTWSLQEGERNVAIRFRELEKDRDSVMDLIGPDVDVGFRLVTHAPAGGVLVPLTHAERLKGSALRVMQVGQTYLKGIQLDAYPLLLVTGPTASSDLETTWS
jgi:class 3 adenylate cyclase